MPELKGKDTWRNGGLFVGRAVKILPLGGAHPAGAHKGLYALAFIAHMVRTPWG